MTSKKLESLCERSARCIYIYFFFFFFFKFNFILVIYFFLPPYLPFSPSQRQLYKTVDSVLYPSSDKTSPLPSYNAFSEQSLLDFARNNQGEGRGGGLKEGDIILQKLRVNYGMRDKNPLGFLHFYNSRNPDVKVNLKSEQVGVGVGVGVGVSMLVVLVVLWLEFF